MNIKYLTCAIIGALSISSSYAAIDSKYIDHKTGQAVTDSTNNNDENTADETISDAAEVSDTNGGLAIGKNSSVVATPSKTELSANSIAIAAENAKTDTKSSLAIGNDTYSTDSSIAIGQNAKTTNASYNEVDAIAIGANSYAGERSTSLGFGASASGYRSVALGYGAQASEASNVAVGYKAVASGKYATAYGANAQALADYSVAIGADSVADRASSVSFGNANLQRRLTYVAAGEVAEDSYDAVNGSQLFETDQLIDELGQQITNINETLREVRYLDKMAVKYDSDTHDITTLGAVGGGYTTVTGLQDATLSATSADAVTGSQLHATNQDLAAVDEKVDQLYTDYDNIISGENAKNLVNYDDETHSSITLAAKDGSKVSLSGIKAGEVAAGSTDAVNGSQLFGLNQQVANNTTAITNIREKISNGSLGMVQQDETSKQITVGKDDSSTKIDVTGLEGERVITGVADGTADNDAVNFAQMKTVFEGLDESNQAVIDQVVEENKNYTDSQIKRLEDKYNRKNRRQDAGIASAVAIGTVPQDWHNTTNIGVAVGGYDGQGALAVKVGHRVKENVLVSGNVGVDTTGTAAYGGGFSVGW